MFLQNKLSEIGLLPKEYNELIVYWLPYIQKHSTVFIHFRVGKSYDMVSTNYVNPKPDKELRVFIDFKGVEKKIEIEPQFFDEFKRNGFVLIEWGGSEIKKPITLINKNITTKIE